MNLNSHLLYYFLVLLVGLLVGLRANRFLWRSQRQRQDQLRAQDELVAVPTESPLADPVKVARQQGMRSIRERYRAIRHFVFALLVLLVAIVSLLPILGHLSAAYLSFILGTMTIVIGIAAKPFIENLICGLVITMSQPIRVGDTVTIDGHYGTVERVTLTYTLIKIWDWRRYVVPNHRLLDKEFINHSIVDLYQWASIQFSVDRDTDLALVESLAKEQAAQCETFADYEEPAFWVIDIKKDSVECWVAGWTNSPAEAWNFKHELRLRLLKAFREQGIRSHSVNLRLNGEEVVNR